MKPSCVWDPCFTSTPRQSAPVVSPSRLPARHGPGARPSGWRRSRGVIVQEHGRVPATDRDRQRSRVAPCRRCQRVKITAPDLKFSRRDPVRKPAVGMIDHALQHASGRTADDDRRPRLLDKFGIGPNGRKIKITAYARGSGGARCCPRCRLFPARQTLHVRFTGATCISGSKYFP